MKRIFILLMLTGVICSAQERLLKGDIRARVSQAITSYIDRDKLINTPKNFVYLFSVILSFNDAGKIDSVYFSKGTPKAVNEVMKLDAVLAKKIKGMNLEYKIYAGKLVMVPVFYYRMGDDGIDYNSGFLTSIINLVPKMDSLPKKEWVILGTLMNPFSHNY